MNVNTTFAYKKVPGNSTDLKDDTILDRNPPQRL